MKHYIIDGNNLIGKIKTLNQLHRKNKKQSAEKLAFMMGRFFSDRKATVSLHFDGVQADVIRITGIKIIYSGNVTADEKIKNEIGKNKNPKNIILVT
ncbi:MAG: NYN domain-containing protein, partial [Ignavibacteriales bacterium]